MHDIQRMMRQVDLYEAVLKIATDRRVTITPEVAASLVIAARVEEFSDVWNANIHRAGEGV